MNIRTVRTIISTILLIRSLQCFSIDTTSVNTSSGKANKFCPSAGVRIDEVLL